MSGEVVERRGGRFHKGTDKRARQARRLWRPEEEISVLRCFLDDDVSRHRKRVLDFAQLVAKRASETVNLTTDDQELLFLRVWGQDSGIRETE